MSNIGERLKHLRGFESQNSFAKLLGVPQTTYCRYERGETTPDLEFIHKIRSHFNVALTWLIDGEGIEKNPPSREFVHVQLVEAVLSAGTGSLETSGDMVETLAFQHAWIEKKGNPKNMVVMRVSGDSMEPDICHNDVVLIDQSKKDIYVSRFYAVGVEDSIYIKRIEKEPNKIILVSSNKDYRPIEISLNEYTESQFRIIGKVLWVGREYS